MHLSSETPSPSDKDPVASILNAIGALIVFLDNEGRIVRFNSACETLTGFSAEEMMGRKVWDVLAPITERDVFRTVFERIRAEKRPFAGENHWLTKAGELRLISWSNTVQLDAAGQVEFVIGTGVDITDRLRLEREIIDVSEDERRRIGHELHERLCNHLAGTVLMMEALAGDVRKGNGIDLEGLENATHLVGDAVEHARILARGLVPVTIEEEGLGAALQEMTADVEHRTNVRCLFLAGDGLPELAHTSVATHLYRIAQEAVENAAVHARPTQIVVRMYRSSDSLMLSVKDDGVGIPAEPEPGGLGVHMMRYRARMIGGSLVIGPLPEGGSEVRCTMPSRGGDMHRITNGRSLHLRE